MPKISVIVPVYNVELYLKECMNSILKQTMNDIEVICINDGSTDKSLAILREFEASDTRIRVFNQNNQGPGPARNVGINNATGEFVCFMDPDDWYPEEDILEVLYDKAIQHNVDVSGGSFSDEKDGIVTESYQGANEKYTFHQEGIIQYHDYQFDFGYHRFLYKLDFLRKHQINFPDYRRFQDPPFFVKAMICAGFFYATPKITYRYRKGHNTIQWNTRKVKDLVRGLTDILELSRLSKLAELHKNTVDRLNGPFYMAQLSNVEYDSFELLELLKKASEQVDAQLICEASSEYVNEDSFALKALRPKVSVIISCYNSENSLKECMDSVLGQTLKMIEIICVDGGSIDNTRSILEEYALSDERVRVFCENYRFNGTACNKGIDIAEGKYLLFLDSSAFIESIMLERMYERCEKYKNRHDYKGILFILKSSNEELEEYELILQCDETTTKQNEMPPTLEKQKISVLQNEIARLKNSLSYKLGRAITFLPRKFRGILRHVKEDGIKNTMKYTIELIKK